MSGVELIRHAQVFLPVCRHEKDETYNDGKIECLESGVHKSDNEFKFDLKYDVCQRLIGDFDRDLSFVTNGEGRRRIITPTREKSGMWEKPLTIDAQ